MDINTLNTMEFEPSFSSTSFAPVFSTDSPTIEAFKTVVFRLSFTNNTPQVVEVKEFIPEFRRTHIGGLDYVVATQQQINAIITGYEY